MIELLTPMFLTQAPAYKAMPNTAANARRQIPATGHCPGDAIDALERFGQAEGEAG
jgi:hypothetical protein